MRSAEARMRAAFGSAALSVGAAGNQCSYCSSPKRFDTVLSLWSSVAGTIVNKGMERQWVSAGF